MTIRPPEGSNTEANCEPAPEPNCEPAPEPLNTSADGAAPNDLVEDSNQDPCSEAEDDEDLLEDPRFGEDSESHSYASWSDGSIQYPYGDGDDRTTATVATDAPDNFRPPLAIEYQPKQGGRYLGCCCDYRKAALVLAAFTVATGILDLIFWMIAAVTERAREDEEETRSPLDFFDDDGLNQELDDLRAAYRIPSLWLEGLAVVFGLFMLFGALYFNRSLLLISVVCEMAGYGTKVLFSVRGTKEANSILESYGEEPFGLPWAYYTFLTVVGLLWWYPSLALTVEISQGIMTPETYVREEYSCLCAR